MAEQTARSRAGAAGIVCAFLLCAAVFIAYGYTSNFRYFRPVPEGCGDVFGYAHMAKAISEGNCFREHTRRPYAKALIGFLRQSGYAYEDYYEAIAPPAYHLDDLSARIINQYPPGTSLLLALLPIEYRFHFFPPLCALLFLFVSALAIWIHEKTLRFIPVALALILLFVIVYYPPPLFSLYDLNSLAPTYGFLFAAGYLLRTRPTWSFLFLGTASLFRVANVVFSIPFFLIYFFETEPGAFSQSRRSLGRAVLKRLAASSGLFLLGGFGLYLAYAWRLTGSPFHPTYPVFDRAPAGWDHFLMNLHYFSPRSPWFVMHLILLFLIGIFSLPSVKWTLMSISLVCLNYLFFMSHRIHVINYPYATIFILMGFLVVELTRRLRRTVGSGGRVFRLLFILVVMLAALTLSKLQIPKQSAKVMYRQYLTGYQKVFSEYDVIWGSSKGCIIEYVTGKPTLSLHRGTFEIRNAMIRWLHARGYKQALWVEYAGDKFVNSVMEQLKGLGLSYRLVVPSKPYYGRIIEIL